MGYAFGGRLSPRVCKQCGGVSFFKSSRRHCFKWSRIVAFFVASACAYDDGLVSAWLFASSKVGETDAGAARMPRRIEPAVWRFPGEKSIQIVLFPSFFSPI